MNDEHVISRRPRPRRRSALAGLSAVAVASMAILLLANCGATDRLAVSVATPSPGSVTPGPTRTAGLQQVRAADLERLRSFLGTRDWELPPASGPGDSLVLASDSAGAQGLPPGATAQAVLQVRSQQPRPLGCPTPTTGGAPLLPCTVVHTAAGALVTVERVSSPYAVPVAQEHTRVSYLRTDGATAMVDLAVLEPGESETTQRLHQTQTWLRAYDDKLVAAVTDPRLQADP